jgi:hypothetical protein
MRTTQRSIQTSLRWMRRMLVVILITSNFVTVMLADAAPARQATQGFRVHAVSGASQGQGSITYANAPGTPVASSAAFAGARGTTVEVTSLVTGNGTFSLTLAGSNDTAVSLASRETGGDAP